MSKYTDPARAVGVAGVEHGADERQDVGDGRGGAGLAVDGEQRQRRHVGVEARHLLGGEVEVVDTELARLAQDVVVDVGDVAHQPRFVAEVDEPPLQDVEGQVHLGVARRGRRHRA